MYTSDESLEINFVRQTHDSTGSINAAIGPAFRR
jgi:hypothetical protein